MSEWLPTDEHMTVRCRYCGKRRRMLLRPEIGNPYRDSYPTTDGLPPCECGPAERAEWKAYMKAHDLFVTDRGIMQGDDGR